MSDHYYEGKVIATQGWVVRQRRHLYLNRYKNSDCFSYRLEYFAQSKDYELENPPSDNLDETDPILAITNREWKAIMGIAWKGLEPGGLWSDLDFINPEKIVTLHSRDFAASR
jgi:hypothetical protein